MHKPILLDNESAYQAWRSRKLENFPTRIEQLIVEVNDPRSPSQAEYDALLQSCRKTNRRYTTARPAATRTKRLRSASPGVSAWSGWTATCWRMTMA
ncbi:MAG: hypothetical protein ACYDDT_02190 [Sulfuricella sp.]